MKKAAAILLLILFLFNTAGYKALFSYLSKQADARMEARIMNGSDLDKGLITFKIPLNLPYTTDSKNFEPAEGEVTINGEIYKLVKKKISRDTMIVLCIDHHEKTRIENQDNDYFKKVNDLAANSSKKSDVKQIKVDYFLQDSQNDPAPVPLIQSTVYTDLHSRASMPGYHPLISAPPESSLFC